MTHPLDGIRVLDCSLNLPLCGMMLGDFGADVIHIHNPRPPEGRRAEQAAGAAQAPPDDVFMQMRGSAFDAGGRNKRSIGINLKAPRGRELFCELVRGADVVIEEMRPGRAAKLGVDYETLSALNPRLIYCATTGYGQDGPYAQLAGHDLNYIGFSGFLSLLEGPGGRPCIPQNMVADYAGGGMVAALGVMAALLARERTGRGQFVDAAMLDGVIYLMADFFSVHFGTRVPQEKWRGDMTGEVPLYDVYETKDGKYLSVSISEPWLFANFCRAIGREDLVGSAFDKSRWPEIREFLTETFATRTRDDWFERLNTADTCVGKVLDLDEVANDPQVVARRMIVRDAPGPVPQVGIAPKLSETPGSVRRAPFRRGEHTDEILGKLGLEADEIAKLREEKAIG